MRKYHPTELQTPLQIRQPCFLLPSFSTQALPGKRKLLSNGTAAPVPLFAEEKLYCSIWSKILTGFCSQKESAQC